MHITIIVVVEVAAVVEVVCSGSCLADVAAFDMATMGIDFEVTKVVMVLRVGRIAAMHCKCLR